MRKKALKNLSAFRRIRTGGVRASPCGSHGWGCKVKDVVLVRVVEPFASPPPRITPAAEEVARNDARSRPKQIPT